MSAELPNSEGPSSAVKGARERVLSLRALMNWLKFVPEETFPSYSAYAKSDAAFAAACFARCEIRASFTSLLTNTKSASALADTLAVFAACGAGKRSRF